jgi:lipopolysaccharide/colanic/teichoic acid biosynthesis glycosyltransferase
MTGLALALEERPAELVETELFRIERGFYLTWVKPQIDFVLGLLAVILAAPLLAVIGLAVWLKMGSPVVLKQSRMGRFNVPFTLYKFRTMEPDRRTNSIPFVGHDRRVTHKSADDPRITDLGRWLRASRLDELPQLFNVLRGDLSLVGPRPELVSVINSEYEPWQFRRHAVKPGLTGVWQVSDRGETRLHECTEFELTYLSGISLANDLRIMAATVPALLRRSGI